MKLDLFWAKNWFRQPKLGRDFLEDLPNTLSKKRQKKFRILKILFCILVLYSSWAGLQTLKDYLCVGYMPENERKGRISC